MDWLITTVVVVVVVMVVVVVVVVVVVERMRSAYAKTSLEVEDIYQES